MVVNLSKFMKQIIWERSFTIFSIQLRMINKIRKSGGVSTIIPGFCMWVGGFVRMVGFAGVVAEGYE